MSLKSPVLFIYDHFIFIASLDFRFAAFAVTGRIRFALISRFSDLLSSNKSYSLDDESKDDGSDSGSSGTYSFPAFSLRFEKSVGCVSCLGSGVFVQE